MSPAPPVRANSRTDAAVFSSFFLFFSKRAHYHAPNLSSQGRLIQLQLACGALVASTTEHFEKRERYKKKGANLFQVVFHAELATVLLVHDLAVCSVPHTRSCLFQELQSGDSNQNAFIVHTTVRFDQRRCLVVRNLFRSNFRRLDADEKHEAGAKKRYHPK